MICTPVTGPGTSAPAFRNDRFHVPVEMVLPLTDSAFAETILKRYAARTTPLTPSAECFVHEGQVFAEVAYGGPGRQTILLPTRVWLWERREAGGGFTQWDVAPKASGGLREPRRAAP